MAANLVTTSPEMFPRRAVGSVAFFAGHILQLTHSHASLRGIAASVYLFALAILCLLAPELRKVELNA